MTTSAFTTEKDARRFSLCNQGHSVSADALTSFQWSRADWRNSAEKIETARRLGITQNDDPCMCYGLRRAIRNGDYLDTRLEDYLERFVLKQSEWRLREQLQETSFAHRRVLQALRRIAYDRLYNGPLQYTVEGRLAANFATAVSTALWGCDYTFLKRQEGGLRGRRFASLHLETSLTRTAPSVSITRWEPLFGSGFNHNEEIDTRLVLNLPRGWFARVIEHGRRDISRVVHEKKLVVDRRPSEALLLVERRRNVALEWTPT